MDGDDDDGDDDEGNIDELIGDISGDENDYGEDDDDDRDSVMRVHPNDLALIENYLGYEN